jgi:5-methylcytosine-specific restriction endonuclease McrA
MKYTKHSPQYVRYMNSKEWAAKRKRKLISIGYKCERCGVTGEVLQIHHLTYERFMNELMTDLRAVCEPCHKIEDKERKAAKRREHEKR